MPLVNHEHRKLAGRLVKELGSESRKVVFLETEGTDPTIHDEDPQREVPVGMKFFGMTGLFVAMAATIFGITGWIFPKMFHRALAEREQTLRSNPSTPENAETSPA